jgi:hypothetical protein
MLDDVIAAPLILIIPITTGTGAIHFGMLVHAARARGALISWGLVVERLTVSDAPT